jgi:hypothetical protein
MISTIFEHPPSNFFSGENENHGSEDWIIFRELKQFPAHFLMKLQRYKTQDNDKRSVLARTQAPDH